MTTENFYFLNNNNNNYCNNIKKLSKVSWYLKDFLLYANQTRVYVREKHFKCIWWWCRLSLSMTIVLCVCFILFFKPWPQKVRKNILLHTFAVHFSSLFLYFLNFTFLFNAATLAVLVVAFFTFFCWSKRFNWIRNSMHTASQLSLWVTHEKSYLIFLFCLQRKMMKNCHRVRLPFIRGAVKVFQCL